MFLKYSTTFLKTARKLCVEQKAGGSYFYLGVLDSVPGLLEHYKDKMYVNMVPNLQINL